ncbi:arsenate reductase family protein [Solitalea lacus]|uniref:arsenate reductase family protein n=1 Tax=Solitalea lacus TaxID=2911172 RepID=UPI001EDA07F6|nr:arsenate reductase family protein [Solitalea lacus]UKJ08645.1 arsenate reductase family protein [Solitalea lacus]
MNKIYHLSTCSTCSKIIKNAEYAGVKFEKQDIKTQPISTDQLEAMMKLAGSYEALFSRRSQKFRPMGLHEKTLTENDYRDLILQEYTFLKRPVVVSGDKIFVGNSPKVVEEMIGKLK